MDKDTNFNLALADFEAIAEDMGWTLLEVVREYNHNPEFKRRIELTALNMSCPTSKAIH